MMGICESISEPKAVVNLNVFLFHAFMCESNCNFIEEISREGGALFEANAEDAEA